MKIAVFGNSNIVMMFNQIRLNLPEDDFVFLAMGGSPSPSSLFQLLLNLERLKGFDIAIIEPIVIDFHSFKTEAQLRELNCHVTRFIARLVSINIHPVLVVLPPTPNAKEDSSVSFIWKSSVAKAGGMILDLNLFLSKAGVYDQIDTPELLWRDQTHHIAPLHHYFIDCIVESVNKIRDQANINLTHCFSIDNSVIAYSADDIRRFNNGVEVIELASAGGACLAKLIKLDSNELALVPPSSQHYLYGLIINWGGSDGSLGFTLNFSYNNQSKLTRILYFDCRHWALMLSYKEFKYLGLEAFPHAVSISIPEIAENSHCADSGRIQLAGVLWDTLNNKNLNIDEPDSTSSIFGFYSDQVFKHEDFLHLDHKIQNYLSVYFVDQ